VVPHWFKVKKGPIYGQTRQKQGPIVAAQWGRKARGAPQVHQKTPGQVEERLCAPIVCNDRGITPG